VNTEITENVQGYVFFDARCPICRKWVGRLHGPLVRRAFHPVPLQAGWAKQKLALADGEPLREMKLLMRDGKISGGADALVQIARAIWWLWPLFVVAQIPGAKILLRKTYLFLAARRPCDDGYCPAPRPHTQKHHHTTSSLFELP
jgi:predicted DCC family thiol-disulfide oxidoreductase YuxK